MSPECRKRKAFWNFTASDKGLATEYRNIRWMKILPDIFYGIFSTMEFDSKTRLCKMLE